jgi:DNA-binding response OmpR family regulator
MKKRAIGKSAGDNTLEVGDADLQVVLVASAGGVGDRIRSLLVETGIGMEMVRRTGKTSADVWRSDADVIVLVNDAESEIGADEQLRRWRARGLITPVLVVTDAVDVALMLDLGADDCVTPTIAPAEMRSRLRALVRRSGVKKATLQIADLRIDLTSKRVERGGQAINLTPREYEILEFLARYQGRVVTRQMLWHRLYGENNGRSSNIVDVYIRYLRQKIDTGFERPLIHTRWGRGYVLTSDEGTATR